MRRINNSVRNNVISMLSNNVSSRKIAKCTGVSRTYVDNLRKEVFPEKEVSKGGRPAKLSAEDKRACVRMSTVGGLDNAVQVANQLNQRVGVRVSPKTVYRTLKAAGLSAVAKVKKPRIDERMRRARLRFAKQFKDYTVEDWRRVVWSDETKINRLCSDGRTWVWVRDTGTIQPKQVKETVKHGGESIQVWSAISAAGPGWLCKIDDRMDKELYLQILKDELQQTMEYTAETMGLRLDQLTFQHDNDSKHTAKVVQAYLQQQPYEVLVWPSHSPDLNPIEHMWALLKRKLNEYDTPPSGINELFERITDVWYNKITKEDCLAVIDSMPDRIRAVIKANGYWTKY